MDKEVKAPLRIKELKAWLLPRIPSKRLGVWSGWSLCLKLPSEELAVLLIKKYKNQTNKIIKRTCFRITSVPSSFAHLELSCSRWPEWRGRADLGGLGGWGGRPCPAQGRARRNVKKKKKKKNRITSVKKKKLVPQFLAFVNTAAEAGALGGLNSGHYHPMAWVGVGTYLATSGGLDLTQSFMKVPKAIWRWAWGGEGGSGTGAPWSSQGHSMQTVVSFSQLGQVWGGQQLSAPGGPQSGQLSPHPPAHRGGLEKQEGC